MTTVTPVTPRESASVIEQSLLAFGAGMDQEALSDVKYAYQYASLVASKKFPDEGQTQQWFNEFSDVMRSCGWVRQHYQYVKEVSESQALKLGDIAFKSAKVAGQALLSNPLTDALVEMLEKAVEGLGTFTKAQEIFDRNFKERQSTTIGLVACVQNPAGEIVLVMGAMDVTPFSDHALNTLVFEWKSNATALYSSSAGFVFNRDIYAGVREVIKERLKDRAKRNVLDYEI